MLLILIPASQVTVKLQSYLRMSTSRSSMSKRQFDAHKLEQHQLLPGCSFLATAKAQLLAMVRI